MKKNKQNQKGISLLLTVLIMAALLSISFGLSKLSLGEIRISSNTPKSLSAYYVAEAGVECQMYDDWIAGVDCGSPQSQICLDAGQVCYWISKADGTSPNRIIISNGSYKETIRAVELEY